MNLSVVPMTTVKFKSAFQHAWWAVNILWELLCIWSDWKSLKLLIKLLQRHSHQIQGNWAGKNFITASRVNSRLITYARMQRWIWNLQLPTVSTFEYSWISRKRSPKMQDLLIAYGRWSLTRIEPQGTSSEKSSGYVYFMGDNLLHAISNLCHM